MKSFWYIASYPRSGNTWCRIFISEIFRLKEIQEKNNIFEEKNNKFDLNKDLSTGNIMSNRNWIDDQLGINSSYLHQRELDPIRGMISAECEIFNESIRYHKIHDAFITQYSNSLPIVPINNCKGVLYLVRNPEDVSISLSHFSSWEFDKTIDFMINKHSLLKESRYQVPQFLGSWDYHFLSWNNQTKIPLLLIKYEDLLIKPFENFKKIANFFELEVNRNLLKKILINISFNNLKQIEEEQGFFKERPSKCDTFFRSGKKGQGKLLLNKEQRDRIKNSFNSVMKHLNYI